MTPDLVFLLVAALAGAALGAWLGLRLFARTPDLSAALAPIADRIDQRLRDEAATTRREAADGAQALQMLKRMQPDVILMDAVMPVMDGFTACARVQELPNGRAIPVLMITALEDNTSVERAFAAGGQKLSLRGPRGPADNLNEQDCVDDRQQQVNGQTSCASDEG